MPLHPSWQADRSAIARFLFNRDARNVRLARAESRARAQEALARKQTRPFADVETSTIEPPKRGAA